MLYVNLHPYEINVALSRNNKNLITEICIVSFSQPE